MAPKTTPRATKATTEPAQTPAEETPAKPETPITPAATPAVVAPPVAFDWEILPEAQVVDYIRPSAPRIDVEKDTPAPIKERIDASYAAYDKTYRSICTEEAEKAVKSPQELTTLEAKAADAANKAASRVQKFGSEAQAKEFVKLARRYAKYKGWTLKGDVLRNDLKTVGFRAKYPEVRVRTSTAQPSAPEVPPVPSAPEVPPGVSESDIQTLEAGTQDSSAA